MLNKMEPNALDHYFNGDGEDTWNTISFSGIA